MGKAVSDAAKVVDMAEGIDQDAQSIASLVEQAANAADASQTGAALAALAVESLRGVGKRMSAIAIMEDLARQADAEAERYGS